MEMEPEAEGLKEFETDLRALWIASYPKSGNTWVRLFLSSYAFNKPADINSQSAVPYIRKYVYDSVAGDEIDHKDIRVFALLKQAALWKQLQEIKVRPLVMKTHDIAAEINGIPLFQPNLSMGAIYLVRDPRDVVISLSKHMGSTIDDTIAGMQEPSMVLTDENMAPNFISSWDLNVNSWIKNTDVRNCHILKYEELYDNPRDNFRRILEVVLDGHEIDEERFEQALRSTGIKELQTQEEHSGFSEASKHGKFFEGGGGYGKWKTILTPEQVFKIESVFADTMEELGYELSLVDNNVIDLNKEIKNGTR